MRQESYSRAMKRAERLNDLARTRKVIKADGRIVWEHELPARRKAQTNIGELLQALQV